MRPRYLSNPHPFPRSLSIYITTPVHSPITPDHPAPVHVHIPDATGIYLSLTRTTRHFPVYLSVTPMPTPSNQSINQSLTVRAARYQPMPQHSGGDRQDLCASPSWHMFSPGGCMQLVCVDECTSHATMHTHMNTGGPSRNAAPGRVP